MTAAAGMADGTMPPKSLCRNFAACSPIFLSAWIAQQMPIKLDADREHYLEGFRRAGLN